LDKFVLLSLGKNLLFTREKGFPVEYLSKMDFGGQHLEIDFSKTLCIKQDLHDGNLFVVLF